METPSLSRSVRQTATRSRPRPPARGRKYSTTRLRTGDELLIVTPSAAVDAVHERLVAVSRAGRLAGWVPDPYEPPSRADRAKARAKRIARKAGSVLPPNSS